MKHQISATALLACLALAAPAAAQTAAQTAPSTQDAIAHFNATRADLDGCFRVTVVDLGRGNQESADTVVRAARAKCAPQVEALGHAYEAIYTPMYEIRGRVRDDQAVAENAAVAALLEARSR